MPPRSILPRACARPESRRYRLPAAGLVGAVLLALASGLRADWPQDQYNPAPAKDDVILPMPCGGAMAFRKVFIPQQRPLDDYPITLGGTEDSYGYAENVHPAHIAGSFPEGANERYFLLGKYEVSRLQYGALEGSCPEPGLDKRLPQGAVSWFDAVAFADRYSRWLRQNAADRLPKDGGEPGYARLPTEVEWEFAARGGLAVSPADFRERTFPVPEGLVRYAWFDGTQSANGKAQMMGLLKPNPLGLHDMLGNLDEMVLEPFRLNRLDRLHGQAGGFVLRGGNFFTPERDLRSAYRKEVPYYKGAEPVRSPTTGFRLVIAGPVITSRERLQGIREAWGALGKAQPVQPAAPTLDEKPLADPVEELGVLAEAADSPNLKSRLGALQKQLQAIRLELRTSLQQQEDKRRLAARAALRLGAFLCQKLSNDGHALVDLIELIANREKSAGKEDGLLKRYQAQRKEEEAVLGDNLQYYAETVLGTAQIYDHGILAEQLQLLEAELKRKGLEEIGRFAGLYQRQVQRYRSDAKVARSAWLDECKSIGK